MKTKEKTAISLVSLRERLASEEISPINTLISDLASKTVSKYISVGEVIWSVVLCYASPR